MGRDRCIKMALHVRAHILTKVSNHCMTRMTPLNIAMPEPHDSDLTSFDGNLDLGTEAA